MSNELPAKVREVLAAQRRSTVSYIISPTGDNNTFKFNADDLDADTKQLTNAMTVGTIQEGHNQYQVATERTEITLTNDNGIPSAISDEAPGGDGNSFLQIATVGQGQKGGKAYFINLSDSGLLNIKVVKGKAVPGDDYTKNYNDLLAEANRDDNSSNLLGGAVYLAQAVRNTYYSGEEFLPETGIEEQNSNVGKNLLQSTIGSYKKLTRGTGRDVGRAAQDSVFEVNQNMMKSLGSQVTLKGSGEYYVPKSMNDEGEILLAQAAALAPGLARLGLPVPFNLMRASSVLQETNPSFENVSLPILKEEDERQSFGSTYNWLVLFDGFQTQFTLPAIGIQLGAIAAIISLAAQVYRSEDASLIRAGFLTYFNIKANGNPQDPTIFAAAIAEAVALGAATAVPGVSFFISSPLAEATGWYTTVLRKITKIILDSTYGSALNLAGNFEANSLVGTLGATINGISNVAYGFGLDDLLETLKTIGSITSRTYGSLNGIPAYQTGFNRNLRAYQPINKGYIDSIVDNVNGDVEKINVAALIKKDRLKKGYNLSSYNGKNTLAWGTSTTPSSYLIPTNLKLAAQAVNSGQPVEALENLSDLGAIDSTTGRLNPELVRQLENELESSYMPFYFHDLRTNEIVSFHAFLESSKDGFNAEWNSISTYGRVEPIHIYKGTTRDISVSFYVVATNEKDHDNMWFKINKLVTMVYPQFTKGRSLTTNEGKTFTQPFSQIPGGSPIIRMRLGDVWKSNYSKFNVARLFGLGQSDFNIDPENRAGASTETYQRIRAELITYRDQLIEKLSNADFIENDEFILTYNNGSFAGDIGGRSYVFGTNTIGGPFADFIIPTYLVSARGVPDGIYTARVKSILKNVGENKLYSEYKVQLLGLAAAAINQAGTDEFIIRFRSPNYPVEAVNLATTGEASLGAIIGGRNGESVFASPEEMAIYMSCGDLEWRYSDAYATSKVAMRAQELADEQRNTYNVELLQTTAETIRNFFNSGGDDPNPIMQAFESTAGKGMAVAFKGIDIDWSGSPWETRWSEDRSNSRAPMWLKISMNGSVIHDIVPGLDSDGFTRAAAYQVGNPSNALNNVDVGDVTTSRADRAATASDSATSMDSERDAPAGLPDSPAIPTP
jgi:hypothetical protein